MNANETSAGGSTRPAGRGGTWVAYGTQTLPEAVRTGAGTDGRPRNMPGAPAAFLETGATLRLWDPVHPFVPPPRAEDRRHAQDQLRFLQAHVASLCGAWARPLTDFVAAYFGAVRATVLASEKMLEGRSGALCGLVEIEHWCFAAPMPLPRAHLPVGDTTVRVDVAFHAAGRTVACLIGAGSMTPGRRAEITRLQATGVTVEELPSGACADGLLDRLGPAFSGFLDGVTLPRSPFRGSGLPEPRPR